MNCCSRLLLRVSVPLWLTIRRVDLRGPQSVRKDSPFEQEPPDVRTQVAFAGISGYSRLIAQHAGIPHQQVRSSLDQGLQDGVDAITCRDPLIDLGDRRLPSVAQDDAGADSRKDVAIGVDVDVFA